MWSESDTSRYSVAGDSLATRCHCPCVLTWSDVNDTSTAAATPSPRSGGNATEPNSLPRGASKLASCSAVDATSETPICTRPASTFVAASPTRDSFSMRWPSPPSESRRPPYSAVDLGAWEVPLAAAAVASVSLPAPVVSAPSVSCRSMAVKSEEQVRTSVVLVPVLIGSEIPSDELTMAPTNLDACVAAASDTWSTTSTTACSRPKYTRTNYGYGIVFFPEFQSTILHMYRMRKRPRNILVLGSNLGTEALYLSHIFGSNTTVVGIEILSTLFQFSKENAAKHGFHQQVEFHCMDALDVDTRMLARSDLILIDNQVWDLTLSLEIVSMLRRKNKMKKGTIVVDFASATKREVKHAMLISSSVDLTLSTHLLSPFVMVEETFHVATSWLVKPGARMNAYVRR